MQQTTVQTAIDSNKERQLWNLRFLRHRCQCWYRHEPHKLTKAEFLQAWHDSGQVPGRGTNTYCMTRLDPRGAWQVGNIVIQPRLLHFQERSTKQKLVRQNRLMQYIRRLLK